MTDAAKNFIETYERTRGALPAAGLGWLDARRDAALKAFAEAGLPHRRLEDWRYTDLRQVLEKAALAPAPDYQAPALLPDASRAAVAAFANIDRHVIVFVNGRLRTDLSKFDLPAGVALTPLAAALAEPWARALMESRVSDAQAASVVALNTALMRDGMGLHIAGGVKLDKPLHLLFLAADDGASHTRNLIRLEEDAEATIFETHLDAGGKHYFSDIAADVSLAEGARLTHVKVQDEAPAAIHLANFSAALAARSHLSSFAMTLGGALSRGQSFIRFDGEGAQAHVNGATALRGHQHGDQFCIVDHAVPGCASATLFRTVLDDAATGVFQGKVIVRPDAQKTDGRQMTNALLLSRDAAMNAKPELEIYADDVQCAHGSTIGELNREALFYLRSRGIDEETARQLLISAFLDAAFETVPHEVAREALRELAAGWFRLAVKEAK
ncbi:MAG: Fe-S cluster assembly protein SufD [Parvibaculum sp.]|uniref:Fe-S cluster assembly protein SufD n=1 Tax=Parvibaculum sp. TaxID=2024848 RepID=UPI0025EFA5A4|nr:Fe-S cluster assembly protein SufD [Parvibaculum sp.]MCE9650370.1 Fe-S cluster assembly protein SufD [Parvibaculum sp.]